MTGGIAQSVSRPQNTWAQLPTSADRVDEAHSFIYNLGALQVTAVQLVDRDPLSKQELADLTAAELEIRDGRFTVIPQDVSDEELFHSLDSE